MLLIVSSGSEFSGEEMSTILINMPSLGNSVKEAGCMVGFREGRYHREVAEKEMLPSALSVGLKNH